MADPASARIGRGMTLCAVGSLLLLTLPAVANGQNAGEQVSREQDAAEQGASPAPEQTVDTAQDLEQRLLDEHMRTRIETPPPSLQPLGLTQRARPKVMPSSGPYPRDYYPPAARAEGREGTVGFTLTIGTNGRPTDCIITASSGHADLDAATCIELMKRARFDPAMENGVPVIGTYSNHVRWALRQNREPVTTPPTAKSAASVRDHRRSAAIPIPKGMNRPVKPRGNPAQWILDGDYPWAAYPVEGTVGFMLQVSADGRPTGCKITASSGSPDLDAATCLAMMKRARFDPKVVDGQPVSSTYSNRVRWAIPR